jgi:hypothetical protein
MDDRPLAQRSVSEESILHGRIFAAFFSQSGKVHRAVCPQQCCHEQLRRILMSVLGMSSRHFGYAADAFEFGFDLFWAYPNLCPKNRGIHTYKCPNNAENSSFDGLSE